ncbi:unnamed protein product [Linum trigynum]|uniref:Uncharacterized protein n=1 Tax=Linum trigynum TaxID=586398 RepID=A0AAV2FM08_9ROSI
MEPWRLPIVWSRLHHGGKVKGFNPILSRQGNKSQHQSYLASRLSSTNQSARQGKRPQGDRSQHQGGDKGALWQLEQLAG